jgi:hypothetical protein
MYGGIHSIAASAGFTYLGTDSEYNSSGYAKIANWFATALNGFRASPASLPPVFDAYAYGTGSAVSSIVTNELTTTLPNELIYVAVVATGSPSRSISDAAGLTWIPRITNGARSLYSWYAVAPNVTFAFASRAWICGYRKSASGMQDHRRTFCVHPWPKSFAFQRVSEKGEVRLV